MTAPLPVRSLVLLAALDRKGVLGRAGAHPLPWRLPADLRRFKARTLGCPVLMGRNTAQSIGGVLPGRLNLVLTRSDRAPFRGQIAVSSMEDAMERCEGEDLKVIGGSEVYALALPLATGIELTHVDVELDIAPGEAARFPVWGPALEEGWREVAREGHPADERNAHAMAFVDYARRGLPQ